MKSDKTGFLLTEALLAMLILGLVSSSVFFMISASNRNSMNAWHSLLGEQLCNETIEVFRSIGYNRLSDCHDQYIADYQLNEWQPVTAASKITGISRPEACSIFARKITMQLLEKDGINGILVKVSVKPLKSSGSEDNQVSCSALLMEQP